MAEEKIDITGRMIPQRDGWVSRVEALCKPEEWDVSCLPSTFLLNHLSAEEQRRLRVKIGIVERATRVMLAGMVKGTVKYSTDNYTMEQWMASVMGEGCDFINYINLMFTSWQLEKQQNEDAVAKCNRAWEENK